jgi:hypothetical protein
MGESQENLFRRSVWTPQMCVRFPRLDNLLVSTHYTQACFQLITVFPHTDTGNNAALTSGLWNEREWFGCDAVSSTKHENDEYRTFLTLERTRTTHIGCAVIADANKYVYIGAIFILSFSIIIVYCHVFGVAIDGFSDWILD